MDLITALAIGLFGSLHCVGMCGPIAMALPFGKSPPMVRFGGTLLYHAGKLSTYAILGALFGTFGKGLDLLFGYQQSLSLITGGILILFGVFPFLLRRLESKALRFTFFGKVRQRLAQQMRKHRMSAAFATGFFNGMLPCGLVFIALSGAIANADALSGAMFMFFFGLGTIPLMLIVSFLPALWQGKSKLFSKIFPAVVLFFGLLFILRGLNLGIPYLSPQLLPDRVEVVECH